MNGLTCVNWSKLRFIGVRADAVELTAAGAAAAVLFMDFFRQVDSLDVGDCHQPRQDVGEFRSEFVLFAPANRRRQLADFFHEPHKRAFSAAFDVFLVVHVFN